MAECQSTMMLPDPPQSSESRPEQARSYRGFSVFVKSQAKKSPISQCVQSGYSTQEQ